MAEKSQSERLERVKQIIELLYGPKGAAEAARRLDFSPSGLAATLRGERGVTTNLELRLGRLAVEDSERLLKQIVDAKTLGYEIIQESMPDGVIFLTKADHDRGHMGDHDDEPGGS